MRRAGEQLNIRGERPAALGISYTPPGVVMIKQFYLQRLHIYSCGILNQLHLQYIDVGG